MHCRAPPPDSPATPLATFLACAQAQLLTLGSASRAPLVDRHPLRDIGLQVDEVVRDARLGHHAASSPNSGRSSVRSRTKSSPRAV